VLEVVLEVVEVLVVDVAELEELDGDVDEVVDALDEVDVVLVLDAMLDVALDVEEVAIGLVVELLAWGEGLSVNCAPTAATAITTTTIPAKAALLTALRRPDEVE